MALSLALAIACGGSDDNGGNGGGGGAGGGETGGSQVSNGARLGWNQSATSLQQAQSMSFRVYVDDSPMSMSAVSCSQGTSTGTFDCSGLLPTMTSGRHQIALTSILANVESARSAAITITITASTTESTTPGDGSDKESGSGSSPSTVCFDNPRECYSAHVIARGLRDAAALTALPDGRLLFIENGSHVRVIADDVLLSAPALTSSSDARLLSLAVDTSSSDTTSVFVAWTEAGADGRPHLNITRYREVAGTLGEGATIVTGLPFAEGGSAPLAVDSRGLLYVAVPATTADGHGVVLRFTRDGFVPEVNWRGLPVFSSGYALPTSLAIDVNHDRLWLAGRDRDWLSNVSSMKLVYDPAFTEGRPEPIDIQELPPFDSSLALFPGRTGSGVSLIVSAAGRLVSGALGGSGTITALSPVDTSPFVMLGPATSGAHGKWYALSGSQENPQSLLSLTPTR